MYGVYIIFELIFILEPFIELVCLPKENSGLLLLCNVYYEWIHTKSKDGSNFNFNIEKNIDFLLLCSNIRSSENGSFFVVCVCVFFISYRHNEKTKPDNCFSYLLGMDHFGIHLLACSFVRHHWSQRDKGHIVHLQRYHGNAHRYGNLITNSYEPGNLQRN